MPDNYHVPELGCPKLITIFMLQFVKENRVFLTEEHFHVIGSDE